MVGMCATIDNIMWINATHNECRSLFIILSRHSTRWVVRKFSVFLFILFLFFQLEQKPFFICFEIMTMYFIPQLSSLHHIDTLDCQHQAPCVKSPCQSHSASPARRSPHNKASTSPMVCFSRVIFAISSHFHVFCCHFLAQKDSRFYPAVDVSLGRTTHAILATPILIGESKKPVGIIEVCSLYWIFFKKTNFKI